MAPVRNSDPRLPKPSVDRHRTSHGASTAAPAPAARPATSRAAKPATPSNHPTQTRRNADAFEGTTPRRAAAHEAPAHPASAEHGHAAEGAEHGHGAEGAEHGHGAEHAHEAETNGAEFNGMEAGKFESFATSRGHSVTARGSSTHVSGRGEVNSSTVTRTHAGHGEATQTTDRHADVTLANGRSSSSHTHTHGEAEHEGGLRHAVREAEVGTSIAGRSVEGSARLAGHTFGHDPRELHTTGAGLDVSVGRVQGSAGVGTSANLRELTVSAGATASGQADLVNVTAHAQLGDSERLAAVAHGEARVGVNGSIGAGVTVDPRHGTAIARAGVDGFAGAEATGHVGLESRYGGASVEGRAQAGIGGAAAAEVGISHGSVHAHVDLGACVGLGARVSVNVDVNVGNIAKDSWHAASSFVHNHHLW